MDRKALISAIFQKQSFLCVGLDTDPDKLPGHLRKQSDAVFEFNKQIIDATRDYCVAYKPNLAFYEARGAEGWRDFERTVEYIGTDHLIIADAKRGDIGNTSQAYAKAFFEHTNCDALTVAPYMGEDSVKPFLAFPGKWVILLALTSNPSSKDFQLIWEGNFREQLWEKVVRTSLNWGSPENLMFVLGATQAEAFKRIRTLAPDHFLLVPGVGAQGGDLEMVCKHGLIRDCGLLINVSRSILYASSEPDFATAARSEALKIQRQMANALADWKINRNQ